MLISITSYSAVLLSQLSAGIPSIHLPNTGKHVAATSAWQVSGCSSSELWSSCLHDKHYIHWAISQPQTLSLKEQKNSLFKYNIKCQIRFWADYDFYQKLKLSYCCCRIENRRKGEVDFQNLIWIYSLPSMSTALPNSLVYLNVNSQSIKF